jgi:hypothetical protein
MREGRMDNSGYGLTMAGVVIAAISVVLGVLVIAMMCQLFGLGGMR